MAYDLQLLAEFSPFHEGNRVRLSYPAGSDSFHPLIDGPDGNYGLVNPPVGKRFRFFHLPPDSFFEFDLTLETATGHRFFTENQRNPNGQRRVRIFEDRNQPGCFLIGFEDDSGDQDFQDVVLRLCQGGFCP